ncbi:hypothetical protein QE152_g40014 [Popillia japonica]|uniref:Uncharacterized protein n=1 Tax=Popillia japonica TaxID=7064 RepID=A0AAW1HSW8_POPJA
MPGFRKESFAEYLRQSWNIAKAERKMEEEKAAEEAMGIIKMKYSEYKSNYAGCKTVNGSYDSSSKTIKVYTMGYVAPVSSKPVKMVARRTNHNKPRPGGYEGRTVAACVAPGVMEIAQHNKPRPGGYEGRKE